MKMSDWKFWLVAVATSCRVLGAELGPSESTRTNAVTLESLVEQALRENPELQFYRAELAAARAGRKTAALMPNPELGGSVGYKNSRERSTGATEEGVAWSVSLVQPFEWPGR
jgi:outer membrane protein TolC